MAPRQRRKYLQGSSQRGFTPAPNPPVPVLGLFHSNTGWTQHSVKMRTYFMSRAETIPYTGRRGRGRCWHGQECCWQHWGLHLTTFLPWPIPYHSSDGGLASTHMLAHTPVEPVGSFQLSLCVSFVQTAVEDAQPGGRLPQYLENRGLAPHRLVSLEQPPTPCPSLFFSPSSSAGRHTSTDRPYHPRPTCFFISPLSFPAPTIC